MSSNPPPPPKEGEVEETTPPEGGVTTAAQDPGSASGSSRIGANLVGFLGALAIPVIAIGLLVWSFRWLRDTEASKLLVVLVAVVVGVGAVFALYYGLDRVVNMLPEQVRDTARAWVFVGPALVVLGVFLVYPAVYTTILSFQDASGSAFVGLDNYKFVFTEPDMLRSIRNTAGWILIVPTFAVGIGLIFAVLVDRLERGEAVAKSLIFLPMAISFVGASVVWGLVYDFTIIGSQTGLLNAIYTGLTGNQPVNWVRDLQPWNNLFLMVIMVWMQTGFAMVILSAAIKSVPEDILEAARIDGATEFQVFTKVIIPSIMSSIVVVTTTLVINVLKVFDIVFVMTNGDSGTEVIAERMIRYFFRLDHDGRGAAIAVVLFVAIIPVMYVNVRRFRAEEAMR